MAQVKLKNIPTGHDGNGYVIVDGKVEQGFQITKVSAQLDVARESRRFLGDVMAQNAARGMAGSGSISYCHCTTALMDALRAYKDGEGYPDITVQYWVENGDQGRCEVVLRGVVLDTVAFGALDDDSEEIIVNESAFSFDDFDIISRFGS